MRYDCLIVDDEQALSQSTCEYFNLFDVSCAWVPGASECQAFLKEHETRLILLDVNLGGGESGFALCKQLREHTDIPILFISARGGDDDMLLALTIGGDDYIQKPYSLGVLLAKVNAVLKRAGDTATDKDGLLKASGAALDEPLSIGDVTLDLGSGRVYRDGVAISLKAMELRLLAYLVRNRGRVVPKEELFARVWGDVITSDGTLNVHIRHLREKIERDPNDPRWIHTVWGIGYLLENES